MSTTGTKVHSRWPVVQLGDICDIGIGRTPARSRREYWGPGSPWLSIADMNQGRDLDTTAETITDVAVRECNCRLVPAGTVLLSFKLSIGKVGIARRPMFTNEAIAALPIRDGAQLLADFLYWALRSSDLTLGLDRAAKGLTLNSNKLHRVRIPLPPLPEQRRIAETLDKADALRAKRRATLAQLDTLTQSIFVDMFGDPVTNPQGWPTQQLVEHADVTYGFPFDSQFFGAIGTQKVVRIRDVLKGNSETFYSGSESFEPRHVVNNGDILVGMDGEFNCNRWTGGMAVLNQRVCRFAARGRHLDSEYLYSSLPRILKRLEVETPFVTVKHLSAKQIRGVRIPLPPISLQEEFARRVAALHVVNVAQQESMSKLDGLFIASQFLAFRGELVT